MKFEILHTKGKWTVNGKTFNELNAQEQKFMNDFFIEMKIDSELKLENTLNQ